MGNFTVRWEAVDGASSYHLQQAQDSAFSNPITVYTGPNTSTSSADWALRATTTVCKPSSPPAARPWSNVQSVDVCWEAEPNNTRADANGPIVSGLTYYGLLPNSEDGRDYFYFQLTDTHEVEISLENIGNNNDFNVALRGADGAIVRACPDTGADQTCYSANRGNDYLRSTPLPPGIYYAHVIYYFGFGTPPPYHLKVTFE